MANVDSKDALAAPMALPSWGVVAASLAVLSAGLLAAFATSSLGAGKGTVGAVLLGVLTAAAGSVSWWMILRRTYSRNLDCFTRKIAKVPGCALSMCLQRLPAAVTSPRQLRQAMEALLPFISRSPRTQSRPGTKAPGALKSMRRVRRLSLRLTGIRRR